MLPENIVRFLDRNSSRRFSRSCPLPVIRFAYITGWRLADEVLPLT
jgi:hypothetical protein